MPLVLPRRYGWTVEHWQRCVRIDTLRRDYRRRPIWAEHCRTLSTAPPNLMAADGCRIPFPRRVRRHEAYRNADEVTAVVYLDVDAEADTEPQAAGDHEIEAYDYLVQINIRNRSFWRPVSWTDLVSHPHAGLPASAAGVGVSMATPSGMARTWEFSQELSNGREVSFEIWLPDPDGSW
jgi:hypothetical protein